MIEIATDLMKHPLVSTFTHNPFFAWGCVVTAIGAGAFCVSRSVEAMLITITAFTFAILPATGLI